jgi:hypothetical protein
VYLLVIMKIISDAQYIYENNRKETGFKTEIQCVYCAVRIHCLNVIQVISCLYSRAMAQVVRR